MPYKSRSLFMSYQQGDNILEGFGIGEIPSYNPEAYKKWRADVLSKTNGWHLTERLEIPLAVKLDSAQSAILINEELLKPVRNGSFISSQKRSLTRSIVLFNDQQIENDHIDYTVETEDGTTRMYSQVYKKQIVDPLLQDFADDAMKSRLELIRLDPDSYHDFSNALLEVIHARHARKDA